MVHGPRFRSFALVALPTLLPAQCPLQLQAELPVAGTSGEVLCSHLWDPDGPGPRTEVVVLGGQFASAGSVVAANIVTWDPATGAFAPLGAGLFGAVRALTVTPAGELLAGGLFHASGASTLDNLARWTGSAWVPFGASTAPMQGGGVDALLAMPNGDVYVGGNMLITVSATVTVSHLARWTGTTFVSPGGGVSDPVSSLARTTTGELVVGGIFALAGGQSVEGIAQWDGTTWSSLGSGLAGPNREAKALLCTALGYIVAAGKFVSAGGLPANNIALWDGSVWVPLGNGVNAFVSSLAELPNGQILAGTASLNATQQILQWDFATWSVAGTVAGQNVTTLTTLPSIGAFVAGGKFTVVDGVGAARVALHVGAGWLPLAQGATGVVRCSAELPNGDLVVGGEFDVMGGLARNVARRTGGTWGPLGAGLGGGGTSPVVRAVAALPDGDIVAAGRFTTAGSVAATNIARWDGTSWAPLGAGLGVAGETVYALVALPSGELVAGGDFTGPVPRLAVWNGTSWQPFGAPTNVVRMLLLTPERDLLVGGVPGSIGGVFTSGVARWNGVAWSGFGPSTTVVALAQARDGALAAITGNGEARRWNGSQWDWLGSASMHAVAFAPNGDVLVGGNFDAIGGVPAGRLARWRAATGTWTAVAGGVDVGLAGSGVHDLRLLRDDTVLVGGAFGVVDGAGGAALARVRASCGAAATPYGAGCAGVGGTAGLQASTRPWLGTTFRSLATALPGNGLALHVLGLAPLATPLATLTPLGGAGCTLLATPDVLGAVVLAGGPLALDLPIPSTPALVGATFHEQLVVAEVAPGTSAITRFTSSNGVTATIGSW